MARFAAGLALVLAAVQLARPRHPRLPEEPTRSYGALALVLSFRQLVDPARLLAFVLVLAGSRPLLAAAATAAGSAAALAAAWHEGEGMAAGDEVPGWRNGAALALGVAAFILALGR